MNPCPCHASPDQAFQPGKSEQKHLKTNDSNSGKTKENNAQLIQSYPKMLTRQRPWLLVSEFMALNQVESKVNKTPDMRFIRVFTSCNNFYQVFSLKPDSRCRVATTGRPLTQLKAVGLHQMSQDLRLDKPEQIKYMDF